MGRFWHERAANGEIVSASETYASKWNAVRAAKAKAAATPGSTWRLRLS